MYEAPYLIVSGIRDLSLELVTIVANFPPFLRVAGVSIKFIRRFAGFIYYYFFNSFHF